MDDLDSAHSGFDHLENSDAHSGSRANDSSASPQLQLKRVGLSSATGGAVAGIPILTDISFVVFAGDRLCLIGPSGAGKTSLLRLLNRLSEPTSGMICLEGQDYQKLPVLQLRRQVMLVHQESKLLGMTVQEALAYPLVLQQLSKQAITKRLEVVREQLHIPTDWLGRTELQLSVGQRQLVAIARALVCQPKILLLDEPTSALDAGLAAHTLGVLTELALHDKLTILMINHQLDLAERFCTRVLYLQEGQLLQDTATDQLNWKQLRERLTQWSEQASQDWI